MRIINTLNRYRRKSLNIILHRKSNQGNSTPILLFCYHKVGTVLLSKVFREISDTNNWKFQSLLGNQTELPGNSDVILIGHSLIDLNDLRTPFIGIHFVRDPRDIIVSGYLYHCRTTEKWCINSDFSLKPPILHPKVPYSQQHRTEEWKMKYLISFGNMTYQTHGDCFIQLKAIQ